MEDRKIETGLKPAEQLAKAFHERYEELAPQYGYSTREASAKPWEEVPDKNRGLMIATAQRLIDDGVIELLPPKSERAPTFTDPGSMQPRLDRVSQEIKERHESLENPTKED